MEWLVLGALILIGASIIKWLTERNAKKSETKAAQKHEISKLRLEPSARLPEVSTPTYTFQVNQYILSRAEQNFYKVLSQGLCSQFIILMKVRVADVLQPTTGISKNEWTSSFNKIKSKHFNFLLCSQDTYEIIAAIELDDRSNNQADRKKRDAFLNAACESASFPLIRITARQIYSAQEIKSAVLGSLRDYKMSKAA
ncbi:MAG: DUF2726 domain-containing protein [Gammaproteobacteria bacterium]|nr:MAG: DUF2726 domain-containing protein [Gammaproteobacteria bacterium]